MVTERLARELASPTMAAPDWSDYEWTIARAVAAMHGISPLLSRSLLWRGPAQWKTFLDEQRTHTRLRHERIQELVRSIDRKTHEAGFAATALKGAALHQLGLYEAGDRPMADVDVLVRPSDVERSSALLMSLGFEQTAQSWKERVFTPVGASATAALGEHADNNLKIELHERICERLPWRLTDVSEFVFPIRPRAGLNNYPSNGALMRHLLLHTAGSMAFQGLRILQLHDMALLAERMKDSDWREITHSSPAVPVWWVLPPLALLSRYYEGRVPHWVLAAAGEKCSYFLQRFAKRRSLADVSYSYPWVKAFPGIEWSRSIGEMLEYAANRARPGSAQIAQRERVARTETWAKHGQWAQLSQGRRILKWMVSRPARPVTMLAVASALEQKG